MLHSTDFQLNIDLVPHSVQNKRENSQPSGLLKKIFEKKNFLVNFAIIQDKLFKIHRIYNQAFIYFLIMVTSEH